MPSIKVTYERPNGESVADASVVVRAMLNEEKARHQRRGITFSRDPEWVEDGRMLTAILPYKVGPNYVPPEPEPEPEAEEAGQGPSFTDKPITTALNRVRKKRQKTEN